MADDTSTVKFNENDNASHKGKPGDKPKDPKGDPKAEPKGGPKGEPKGDPKVEPKDDPTEDPKDDCPDEKDPNEKEIPKEEIDKIISDMLEILKDSQQKVDEQKIDSHSLVFMLLRIKETLDAYQCDYFQKLNNFLVQADALTANYYCHMSCALPNYGDYIKAIEEDPDEEIDIGNGEFVGKEDLINLVKQVVDNYYATGMFIKSGRMVFKDVNNARQERRDIVDKIVCPLPKWMEFQDKVTCQLDQIREQTFKISAYVDFLKQGEMKMAPTLDLTPLNNITELPEKEPKTNTRTKSTASRGRRTRMTR